MLPFIIVIGFIAGVFALACIISGYNPFKIDR